MSFIETIKKGLGIKSNRLTILSPRPSEGQNNNYKEWISPDGKRKITVSLHKGPKFEGLLMKDVTLCARDKISTSWAEMLRVQLVMDSVHQQPEYNVYLDAIYETSDEWGLMDICYFSNDNGRLHPTGGSGSSPRKPYGSLLTDNEFRKLYTKSMLDEGVYHLSEIPPEINIEATVSTFIDQVRRIDFSKPVLISKNRISRNVPNTPR